MKRKSKFCVILIILLLICISSVASLPGIEDYLPSLSGEYVYYRDNSFPYEAYIGFLQYDESTYAMRYYAPAPETGSSDVQILFTLDATKDYTEMTGERIVSDIVEADTEVINYLHDLIYEFTARRRKISTTQLVNKKNKLTPFSVNEDFVQFGGDVTTEYLFTIPIFNLKGIYDNSGKAIFSTVTIGRLLSSEDKSFSSFRGFPSSLVDKNRSIDIEKSVDKNSKDITTVKWNNFSIKLDSQWTATMENMWLLGNSAVLVLNTFKTDSSIEADKWDDFLCRRMAYSSEGAYSYFPDIKITIGKKRITIDNRYYHSSVAGITRDIKVLIPVSDTEYGIASLTIFDDIYLTNKLYFDEIISSFK